MSSPFKMDPLERIMMVRAACRVGSRVAPELTPCATPRCQGVTSFDITGQGTCLGSVPSAASAPSTPVTTKMSNKQQKEAALAGAKTASQRPDKKQQMKHALKVQSAPMITTDYVALSQPLVDGILLMDRTDRKLKLIKSLGELQPRHTYTTEYGNTLERTTKYKVARRLDRARREHRRGRLRRGAAKARARRGVEHGRAAHHSDADGRVRRDGERAPPPVQRTPRAPTATATATAVADTAAAAAAAAATAAGTRPTNRTDSPLRAISMKRARRRRSRRRRLQRLEALSERMAEMTSWFEGVKAEAERERRMREQARAAAPDGRALRPCV